MRRVILLAALALAIFSLTYCNSAGDSNGTMDSVNNASRNANMDNQGNGDANRDTVSSQVGTASDTNRINKGTLNSTNNVDSLR